MMARTALDRVLDELAAGGVTWPCAADPERWFEGGPVRLAETAKLCNGCPVFVLCGAVAVEERQRFGVWGGRVFDRDAVRAAS